MTESVCCPLCGITPSKTWFRLDEWTIVKCTKCGLLITWPRPDHIVLSKLYNDERYYDTRSMGESGIDAWRDRARDILGRIGFSPASALDFGAGEGHFVEALRDMGVAVLGVESSAAGRTAARRLYGLDLRSEISADLHGRFDLITLIHSLEHVVDPVATLVQVAALLNPVGVVFIEVPHAGSVDMWRPDRRREILDLPVHLYHFVPLTLSRVVARAGFRVTDVRLSNPDILEWALDKRAHWKSHGTEQRANSQGGSLRDARSQATHSVWAGWLLPWLRNRFRGRKMQLIATKGSELPPMQK